MKYVLVLTAAMVLMFNYGALATNITWGSTSGDYGNANNWWDASLQTHHLPGISDTALITTQAVCTVGATGDYTVGTVYLGEACNGLPANSVSTMVINGKITAKTTVTVGCYYEGTSTMRGDLTINTGGSMTATTYFYLGRGNVGTVTVKGGTLSVLDTLSIGCSPWSAGSSTGFLYLQSGLVDCKKLAYEADASQIIISGGTLKLWNYTQALAAITSGHIVAAANRTLQYASYTSPTGTGMVITVIPEPATIAILGLGGLMFARRKKS